MIHLVKGKRFWIKSQGADCEAADSWSWASNWQVGNPCAQVCTNNTNTQIHKAGKWGINVLRCNEEIAQFVFQTFISIAGWRSRMCAWLEKCNEWWPLKLRLQEMLGRRWKCWTFQQTLTKSAGDPQRGWEKSSESFDWSRLALGTEFGLPTSSLPAGWHLWYRTSEMMMVAD